MSFWGLDAQSLDSKRKIAYKWHEMDRRMEDLPLPCEHPFQPPQVGITPWQTSS